MTIEDSPKAKQEEQKNDQEQSAGLEFARRQIADCTESLERTVKALNQSEMIDPDSTRRLASAVRELQDDAGMKPEDFKRVISAVTKGIEEVTNIRGRMPRRDDIEVLAMVPRGMIRLIENINGLYSTVKNERGEDMPEILVALDDLRNAAEQKSRGVIKLIRGMEEFR